MTMFTIVPKQEMIDKIEQALKHELEDIVIMFPNLHEKIVENMLWAIYSKEKPYKTTAKNKGHHKAFALLSYDIVEIAKKELESVGEKDAQFFVPNVDIVFQKKDFTVFVDYEDCDVEIEETIKTPKAINQSYKGLIASTLPDSGVVFESLVEGNFYDEKNAWVLDYMDSYDQWKHNTMDNYHRYVWQIGGHGRWIQSDYNYRYVAQANIEIGDAGSVFIEIHEEEIKGGIDMY